MAGLVLAGVDAGQVGVAIAVLTFVLLVYSTTTKAVKDRRKERAIIAGKEQTALEKVAGDVGEIRAGVLRLEGAVFDRPPSLAEPQGHKGIQTVQGELIAVTTEHSTVLRKLLPNGGNTDDPGDLILKIARDRGLTENPE